MRPPADALNLLPAKPPGSDDRYRSFIPVSLGLAVFLGFALGVHITTSRLTGADNAARAMDLIQAHGQVQLLGFAGLYVMGMSLRLFPRFTGAKIALPHLMPFILVLTATALILKAIVLPLISGSAHDVVLVVSATALLAAGGSFLLVLARTAAVRQRPLDASAWAFLTGAGFLAASGIVGYLLTIDTLADDARSLSYLNNQALLQLQLGGFLMCFILGVSIRAIPTMVGLERPSHGASLLLLALLAGSVILLAGSLLYLEQAQYESAIARLASAAFLCFGVTMLGLTWLGGALRSIINRLRPASQSHLWLIRCASVWLVVAGAIAIYYGARGLAEGTLPAQSAFDAVRHSLGIGVVTMLIAGLSLMIVPEFAMQRQHSDQSKLAYSLLCLLNLAAVLRIVPALGTGWDYDLRNALMAGAGILAEIALITFAVSLIRLLRRSSPA